MFGLFKKETAPQSPLKEESRTWIEDSFRWLTENFDPAAIRQRKVLRPHHSDFPIRYNGDPQTANDTLWIVATQMEIDPADLDLNIYDDTINQVSTGAPGGAKMTLGTSGDEEQAGESWQGRNDTGKYPIIIEKTKLQNPEGMVAHMARELAQIKLLGEGRITAPDKRLTDLTTIIFGLGVFNANAAFITWRNGRSFAYSRSGYLTQMEWGYGLALFTRFRGETTPEWTQHLSKNVSSDFLKSQQYIAWHNPQ